jgi:hypothetical protein
MKSTRHVQQRPQDQDEGLRAFGDPAFRRTTEKNRSAGYGATVCSDPAPRSVRNIERRLAPNLTPIS